MNKKNIIIFFHPFYTFKDRVTDLLYHFRDYNIYFLLDNSNVDNKTIELLEVYKKNKQICFYNIINFHNSFNKPIRDIEYERIKLVVKEEIFLICKKLEKINFDEIVVSDNTSYEIKYIINSLKNSNTIIAYYSNTNINWTIFPIAKNNKKKKKLAKLGPFKYLIHKIINEINYFEIVLKKTFINLKKIILFKKIFFIKNYKFLKISLDHNSVDKIYYFDENQKDIYEKLNLKKKLYSFNTSSRCNFNQHNKICLLFCLDVYKNKDEHKKVVQIAINELKKIIKNNDNIDKIIIKPHPREESDINTVLLKKIKDTLKIKTNMLDLTDNSVDDLFCNFTIYYGGASTLINIAFDKCKQIKIYFSKNLSDITNPYHGEYIGLKELLKNKDRVFVLN